MSVKALLVTILRNELASRGVHSLTSSDYKAIVDQLLEQLNGLELNLAARELAGRRPPK